VDEYSGDYDEMCQVLYAFAASGRVKLYLSSRPWNIFEDAFGNTPSKLYIEALTRDDITAYVKARLEEYG